MWTAGRLHFQKGAQCAWLRWRPGQRDQNVRNSLMLTRENGNVASGKMSPAGPRQTKRGAAGGEEIRAGPSSNQESGKFRGVRFM